MVYEEVTFRAYSLAKRQEGWFQATYLTTSCHRPEIKRRFLVKLVELEDSPRKDLVGL